MSISNKIIMAKFAIMRTNSYIALANAGMLLFLFIQSLYANDYIHWNPSNYIFPIYGLGFLGLLILGFIEMRLGGMKTEQALGYQLNPEWQDMKDKVNAIYDKVNA